MKPLSRLDISKLTAEELNLDVNMVDEICRSYYKYLTTEMSSLKSLQYNVPGLGSFSVKKNRLKSMIAKQEKTVDMLQYRAKLSLSRYATLDDAKDKLDKLNILLEKLEQQEIDHKQHKQEHRS
jgi:hypothetical protein